MATLTANGGVLAQVQTTYTNDHGDTITKHRALTAKGWILERWQCADPKGSVNRWPWTRHARLKDKATPTPEIVALWLAQYQRKGWTPETPRTPAF